MRRFVVLLYVTFLALFALPLGAQPCGGSERWPVKVGSDSRAGEIDLSSPVSISLHQLVDEKKIPRPPLPDDDTTRVDAERTVYVVEGRLVKFKLESGRTGDMDYHLVISDDTLQFSAGGSNGAISPHSFVAEIVKPECVPGRHGDASTQSRFQSQLTSVRSAFEQRFPDRSGGWNDAGGIPVRITGVGFFDRDHGQTGRAKSGLEIHPILDISFDSTPPSGSTGIQNPGFEDGSQNWTASSGVISNDSSEPARTGSGKAWLGGYGTPHTDTLYQPVTIPAGATVATLAFYLHISTEEQTGQALDTLKVQLRNNSGPTGSLIKTLATFSNLQAAPGFQLRTFDLSAHRGQTVRIYFSAQEDNGSMTSFVLDDFRLVFE